MARRVGLIHRLRGSSGQSIIEFALIAPLVMVLVLGVVDVSYALLDEQVVTRLSREGSNLISRDTTLQDAAVAMTNMSTRPVNFSSSSTVIFSVVKNVATTGANNFGKNVLYRRYQYGSLAATSALSTAGAASFGGAPDYQAANSDSDTSLQVTNLPANLSTTPGGMLYVTEIYTTHTPLTPLDKFGIPLPTKLYAIAYF
jgi:Flp pilus assembly protein TadG